MDFTSVMIILSLIVSQVTATCFVPNTSFDRRDVIQIIPGGLSQLYCQVICMNNPTCLAIQITTTGSCVLFGSIISATYGQCPAPFTCLLRTDTGCVAKARRPIDLGYIGHYCSGAVQSAPADNGSVTPFGIFDPGNRKIFIDALMHDGTNAVFENHCFANMNWDDGIGSWYMLFQRDLLQSKHYFLAAKWVRPPISLRPVCECEQLPMDLPAGLFAGGRQFASPTPTIPEALPTCPDHVQLRFPHELNVGEAGQPSNGAYPAIRRRLYCANKFWIHVCEESTVLSFGPSYTSHVISAASCVVPAPGMTVALPILLFLPCIITQVVAITCFVPNTSYIRRDVLQIVPGGLSQLACQVICLKNPGCTAIQMTTTPSCVLFGPEITATQGQCPAPFTCLLKSPVCVRSAQPCGLLKAFAYIDTLLHDGTNAVHENHNQGRMFWDDGIGSWYMVLGNDPTRTQHYFLAAKCALRPLTVHPGCECEELPMDYPLLPEYTTPSPVAIDVPSLCDYIPKFHVQFRYQKNFGGYQGGYDSPRPRRVYCANKVWMQVYGEMTWYFNSFIVTAASCVNTL